MWGSIGCFYCGELVIINLFVLIRLFGGKWMILVEDKDMYIWYFCLENDEHWLSNWVSCKWTIECARALCNLFVVSFYQGTGILITIGGEEYKQMITRWTSLNLYVIKGILIFICCWLSPIVDKRKYIHFINDYLLDILIRVWGWWSKSRNRRREMEVGNIWALNLSVAFNILYKLTGCWCCY